MKGAAPAAERAIDCGESSALSLKVKMAARFPSPPGLKFTWILQVAPGPIVPHWPGGAEKSLALAPETVKLESTRLAFPEFVTATVWGAVE